MNTVIKLNLCNGKMFLSHWKQAYPNNRMVLTAEYLSVNMQKI